MHFNEFDRLMVARRRWSRGALGLVLAAGAALALAPAARAQDEVPFVTTPDHVTQAMLELAGVQPADFLIDLGSGDGRIVIAAASRFGARGLGVELDPALVALSQRNARRAGVAERTTFKAQDLFDTDLARAQVITLYLLPAVNLQLRPRLLALAPGTRIVSHDWDMGDWQPERSLTLDVPDKPIGLDKRSTLHLWVVPLRVQGRWCTPGGQLDITQRFQTFSASLSATGANAPLAVFDGLVSATGLHEGRDERGATVVLQHAASEGQPRLRLTRGIGPAGRLQGQSFTPAGPTGCG